MLFVPLVHRFGGCQVAWIISKFRHDHDRPIVLPRLPPQIQGAGNDIAIANDKIRLSPVASTAQNSTEGSLQGLDYGLFLLSA
jgi:hypothetical protein